MPCSLTNQTSVQSINPLCKCSKENTHFSVFGLGLIFVFLCSEFGLLQTDDFCSNWLQLDVACGCGGNVSSCQLRGLFSFSTFLKQKKHNLLLLGLRHFMKLSISMNDFHERLQPPLFFLCIFQLYHAILEFSNHDNWSGFMSHV